MDKEEIEKKFEKLSDVNKVRYNLGRIIHGQKIIFLFVFVVCSAIFGCVLSLPFMIRYGSFNRVIAWAVIGFLVCLFASIMSIVGIFRMNKDNEALEKFLNKKQKK